ncbi:MAG: hypothetical protein HY911_05060 [Desulfobacterales bacterium]|nr:hypothetical protein [Desulfobacterales bacterium]
MKRMTITLLTILLASPLGPAFAIDRLATPPAMRTLPSKVAAPAATDWTACRNAATAGSARAIAGWQQQALLKAVVVNGPAASGGNVSGPALQPLMEQTMTAAGISSTVARAFAAPLSAAWAQWAASLRVPDGLNWYPSFNCYAGPVAPPTPNVPAPLAILSGNTTALSADQLKKAIRQALGPQAQEPQAAAAIDGFADDFARRFTQYLTNVKVTNVMGGGRVPTFAAPLINCGPVVAGSANMQPGGFTGTWP